MVADLWVFYSPAGNAITAYYSNQIRQGDSFMLRICFPDDETYSNMTVRAHFSVTNNTVTVCDLINWEGKKITFEGIGSDNHNVGALIKGKDYYVYDIYVNANTGVTKAAGRIPFWIDLNLGKTSGRTYLTVQKTYGNDKMTYITPTEYADIINQIRIHSVVAKQFMTSTEYISQDEVNKITLKSWSGLGFINGLMEFIKDVSGEEEEYIKIAAASSKVAHLKYPATVMGVIYNSENDTVGSDIMFRVDNDESSDEIVLSISADSQIKKGDIVSISGCIPYDGDALRFAEQDTNNDNVESNSVTVSTITTSVEYHEGEPELTYDLSRDTLSDTIQLNLKLKLTYPTIHKLIAQNETTDFDLKINEKLTIHVLNSTAEEKITIGESSYTFTKNISIVRYDENNLILIKDNDYTTISNATISFVSENQYYYELER